MWLLHVHIKKKVVPFSFKMLFLPANADIDECLEENLCGENATCVNTHGSYQCVWNSSSHYSGEEEQGEGEDKGMLFLIVDLKSELILSYKY